MDYVDGYLGHLQENKVIMFYYKNWDDFCKKLSRSGLKLCTSEQSLNLQMGTRFVVLKHDVEDNIPNAYKLAAIEHKYVQAYLLNSDENVRLLKEMQCWGHEISYHYDVLDAHAGDYEAAEKDFIKKSILFADAGFQYGTICQHGNPVKNRVGYTSNRDFFRHPEIRGRYPQWVDMVYDGNTICEQYNWYGNLSNGYWNSVFSKKGCKKVTTCYTYDEESSENIEIG